MPARYRDRYDDWDDDDWGDDQQIISLEEYKKYVQWSLYEDEDGRWRCTCFKYQRRGKCFHMRYTRKENIIKVKEEYL